MRPKKPLRSILAAFGLTITTASCGILFLPYGEATVRATATISIDGRSHTGSAIWRVKAQTQNGWPNIGINYKRWALGDAIEFELGNGVYAFLRPYADHVMSCAATERPGVRYLADALRLFTGPCDAERYAQLTFVTLSAEGEPTFVNFGVDRRGELLNEGGGLPLEPAIQAIADRDFAVRALTISATSEELPSGMIKRFPWILDLPRIDACPGEPPTEGNYCWSRGKTYAQYFTTALPK